MTKERIKIISGNILKLKIALAIVCFVFIFYKVSNSVDILYNLIFELTLGNYLILLAFSLIILITEALKWNIICAVFNKISFYKAFQSILAGVSLGIITPYRLGDFAARIVFLPSLYRKPGISGSVISAASMVMANLMFAYIAFAILFYSGVFELSFISSGVVVGIFLVAFLLTILVFVKLEFLFVRIMPFWYKKLIRKFPGLNLQLNKRELANVLILSVFKTFLFQFQFLLLLSFIGVEASFLELFACISISFLPLFIVPGLGISEIGVRGSSAIAVLGILKVEPATALFASVFIYFINVVVPALFGTVVLIGKRVEIKNNSSN